MAIRDESNRMASTAMKAASSWADSVESTAQAGAQLATKDRLGIVQESRLIGGAMITILIIAVVLNEVFAAVNVGSGPFSQIGTDLENTGVAAVGLLIVGLIIVAANALMNRFGGM
jgi:hypothetical protein